MAEKTQSIHDLIEQINNELSQYGVMKIRLIEPEKLIPQRVNARYMEQEKMNQLTENIKTSGMESVPFCHLTENGYEIISGHHRVEAAIKAEIPKILIMYAENLDRDEVVSKQLAHNALCGKDDPVLLKQLFDSIKDITLKIQTGLQDEIAKINYTSINFKAGEWKEFTVLFLPEDVGLYDEAIEDIVRMTAIKTGTEVRLTDIEYYDKFAKAIRKIKKCENIKSNGTALMRLVELAQETMERNGTERVA